MNSSRKAAIFFGSLLSFGLVPVPTVASALTVSSYSMPDGGTGAYNYQDTTYSNCVAGNCSTTGAALSRGTGRLTNGVIPTGDWDTGANIPGWIGWATGEPNGANPVVNFNFADSQTVNSLSIWYDNSLGAGGVFEPSSVSIDGTGYAFTPDSTEGPQQFIISGLNLTGNSATLQFFQGAGPWIMIGQVSFNSASTTSTTPEPGTTLLMCGGLLALALKVRQSKHHK